MRTMRRGFKGIVLAAGLVLAVGSPAAAIPILQLEIEDGFYDPVTETSLTTEDSFTLHAYLSDPSRAGAQYYLWTAITPMLAETGPDLGSFDLNSATYDVTGDLNYGTPPVEMYSGNPDQDLAPHGIYDTYYLQTAFMFTDDGTGATRADPYDTQTSPNSGPSYSGGAYMLYQSFSVDREALNQLYELHFDLGDTVYSRSHPDDLQVGIFAPFSHDAGTTSGPPPTTAPEPATLILMGSGLSGMALLLRRRERRRDDA